MQHNRRMRLQRPLVLLLLAVGFGGSAAEVLRCDDGAGRVSYTDGACPPGSRAAGRLALPAPAPPAADGGRAAVPAAALPQPPAPLEPAPAPAGPAVIDARGNREPAPADEARWSDRGSDPLLVEDGQVYPYPYPGAAPRPSRPRHMGPRMRNCDDGGCEDRQGNRYDRSGRLERYPSLDGRTCRPVGTTVVCR